MIFRKMNRRFWNVGVRDKVGPVLVIVVLIFFILESAVLFFHDYHDFLASHEFYDNTDWDTVQYERDVLVARVAISDTIPGDLETSRNFWTKLDILWSRVDILTRGPTASHIDEHMNTRDVMEQASSVLAMLDDLKPNDGILTKELKQQIKLHLETLLIGSRQLSLEVRGMDQIKSSKAFDAAEEFLFLALTFGVGAVVFGVLLIGFYFKRNSRLLAFQSELEKEVRLRTVDLTETNDALRLHIAAREQMEKSLRKSQKAAEDANRAKSRFLAHMSHELRTPLNAIIGFAEVMNGEILGPIENPKYRDYIKDIHASGSHLSALLKDILDLAKVEAEAYEPEKTWHHIADSLTSCSRLLGKMQADGQHTVILEPMDDVEIFADQVMVKQIIVNLLSNAFKYAGQGATVTVSFSFGDRFELSVHDDGAGIPENELSRIMEPFRQQKDIEVSHTGGTGLGLALSKSLAELNDGALRMTSKAGEGTTVILSFPNNLARRAVRGESAA